MMSVTKQIVTNAYVRYAFQNFPFEEIAKWRNIEGLVKIWNKIRKYNKKQQKPINPVRDQHRRSKREAAKLGFNRRRADT